MSREKTKKKKKKKKKNSRDNIYSDNVTRVLQNVLSLIGFLSYIPGISKNASLHLNGVLIS